LAEERRLREVFTLDEDDFRTYRIHRRQTFRLGRDSTVSDGNPEFSTVLKVVRALGLRLHATAADADA
jgi:hypothetical protein